MSDRTKMSTKLRYTASGALAALAAAGAIAATVALADSPPATKTPAAVVPAKTAAAVVADKAHVPKPNASPQPFLNAIQGLVGNGTITASEGQVVDREISTGRVDTDTLASAGFTPSQLQAVHQALANTKRALAPSPPRNSK